MPVLWIALHDAPAPHWASPARREASSIFPAGEQMSAQFLVLPLPVSAHCGCAVTPAGTSVGHAAEVQELQQQVQELQAQQQQAAAKQTVEAAARAAGLQIGARIYQQGSGGEIVVAEVVRYDGQKVVCRCVCRGTLLTTIMPFLDSIRPPRLLLLRLFPLASNLTAAASAGTLTVSYTMWGTRSRKPPRTRAVCISWRSSSKNKSKRRS